MLRVSTDKTTNLTRDHLALYYFRGEWWLATRETATKKNADKMARKYKDMGHKVRVIRLPVEAMSREENTDDPDKGVK